MTKRTQHYLEKNNKKPKLDDDIDALWGDDDIDASVFDDCIKLATQCLQEVSFFLHDFSCLVNSTFRKS